MPQSVSANPARTGKADGRERAVGLWRSQRRRSSDSRCDCAPRGSALYFNHVVNHSPSRVSEVSPLGFGEGAWKVVALVARGISDLPIWSARRRHYPRTGTSTNVSRFWVWPQSGRCCHPAKWSWSGPYAASQNFLFFPPVSEPVVTSQRAMAWADFLASKTRSYKSHKLLLLEGGSSDWWLLVQRFIQSVCTSKPGLCFVWSAPLGCNLRSNFFSLWISFLYTCLHYAGLAQVACTAQDLATKKKDGSPSVHIPPSTKHAVGRSNPRKTMFRCSSYEHNVMSFSLLFCLFVLHCVIVWRNVSTVYAKWTSVLSSQSTQTCFRFRFHFDIASLSKGPLM